MKTTNPQEQITKGILILRLIIQVSEKLGLKQEMRGKKVLQEFLNFSTEIYYLSQYDFLYLHT